jgi:hypothetical protein
VSLPKETLLELMSYADGEPLEAAVRARVEELLRTSDEARRVVDAMGTLGDVVRDGIDARAEVPAGIADAVMAAIAQGASVGAEARVANVVPISPTRRSRTTWISSAAAVAAIAAGFFLMARSEKPASLEAAAVSPYALDDGSSLAPEAVAVPAASEATAQAEPGGGVELREVRSIENKVNVFFVPAKKAAGTSSVVIWIDDKHGGR